MKTSIKLIAIALMFTTSAFAAGNKTVGRKFSGRDSVYFNSLINNNGVKLKVKKSEKSYTIVTIYDSMGNRLFTERFSNGVLIERKYMLADEGTYLFVIESPNQKTEKRVIVAYQAKQIIAVKD
jgi:hypothetical protein